MHNTCAAAPGPYNCGDLDVLANRFINNFSKSLKKSQIAEWWAKGYPAFFARGTFFEKLMARSAKYSKNLGWTHTSHTQDVIDFFKKSGNKYEVVSMKTTYQETVSQWMSSNSVHLSKFNDLNKKWVPNNQSIQEIRKLHIYVQDANLGNYSSWITTIKAKYKNIDVEFSSIEKEFNL